MRQSPLATDVRVHKAPVPNLDETKTCLPLSRESDPITPPNKVPFPSEILDAEQSHIAAEQRQPGLALLIRPAECLRQAATPPRETSLSRYAPVS